MIEAWEASREQLDPPNYAAGRKEAALMVLYLISQRENLGFSKAKPRNAHKKSRCETVLDVGAGLKPMWWPN
jgi:hypothetical protein